MATRCLVWTAASITAAGFCSRILDAGRPKTSSMGPALPVGPAKAAAVIGFDAFSSSGSTRVPPPRLRSILDF
jgi:hypothetical protein